MLFSDNIVKLYKTEEEFCPFKESVCINEFKRFAQLALCGLMLVAMVVMAGCGGDKKADSNKKVLKVAMECAYAPYNWSQTSAEGGAVKLLALTNMLMAMTLSWLKSWLTPWALIWKFIKLNGMVWHLL